MDASDIIIAIRRIIVRGGSTLDILRFLDDAAGYDGHPGWSAQTALDDYLDERLEESQRATDPDADLDVPLGEACRIDDPECEACQ